MFQKIMLTLCALMLCGSLYLQVETYKAANSAANNAYYSARVLWQYVVQPTEQYRQMERQNDNKPRADHPGYQRADSRRYHCLRDNGDNRPSA